MPDEINLDTEKKRRGACMVEVHNPPVLFPPLREDDDEVNILSPELRANFDSMRALLLARDQHRQEESTPKVVEKKRKLCGVDAANEADRQHAESGGVIGNATREVLESDENEQKRFNLAVSTVNLIENEMSHLTDGIAELERLLASGSDTAVDFSSLNLPYDSLPNTNEDEVRNEREKDENDSCDVVKLTALNEEV